MPGTSTVVYISLFGFGIHPRWLMLQRSMNWRVDTTWIEKSPIHCAPEMNVFQRFLILAKPFSFVFHSLVPQTIYVCHKQQKVGSGFFARNHSQLGKEKHTIYGRTQKETKTNMAGLKMDPFEVWNINFPLLNIGGPIFQPAFLRVLPQGNTATTTTTTTTTTTKDDWRFRWAPPKTGMASICKTIVINSKRPPGPQADIGGWLRKVCPLVIFLGEFPWGSTQMFHPNPLKPPTATVLKHQIKPKLKTIQNMWLINRLDSRQGVFLC